MKVFRASYADTWKYGGFHDLEYIVVAATIQDALEDVMKEHPKSFRHVWEITEIRTTVRSCVQTYERTC